MIVFVIPAYNEEENIPSLLEGMHQTMQELRRPFHLVLVDDGSTDGTARLAASYANKVSVEVLRHRGNRGVAQAFRTGLHRALEIAGTDDIVVTKEADNTSDLAILETMLTRIERDDDIVLASCFAPEGGIVGSTLDRHVLSFCANLLVRTFLRIRGVHTYSSFYRAYRPDTLRHASAAYGGGLFECHGFACMVEMLAKVSRLPVRITEVPMVLQSNLRQGRSKMVRLRTIVEYFQLITRELRRPATETRRIRAVFEGLQATTAAQRKSQTSGTDPAPSRR